MKPTSTQRYRVLFAVLSLVLSSSVSMQGVSATSFSDVGPNNWFYGDVQKLVDAGAIDDAGSFFPAGGVTRAAAAKIVVKAAGVQDSDLLTPKYASFKDVPKSSWAYPYIETARSLGYVSGNVNGTYEPARIVTRAEFAKMLVQAFELEAGVEMTRHFSDVYSKDWFFGAVETAYRWSVVDGYVGGTFQPSRQVNRAEMAKMVVSAMQPMMRDATYSQNTNGTSGSSAYAPSYPYPSYVNPYPVVIGNPSYPSYPGSGGSSGGGTGGSGTGTGGSGTGGTGGTGGGDPKPPVVITFTDDFTGYDVAFYADGDRFGSWTDIFGGYGTVGIEKDSTNTWMHLSPKAVTSPDTTEASLVVNGASYSTPITYQVKVKTVAQLRTGSTPNDWECGWVVWDYTDNDHFYYFIAKPGGWELGKRDPSYPGGQRFLATGTDTLFPIGQWYTVKISQDASNLMTVWVDGKQITTFTDTEKPYTAGNVGMYTEDAHVDFDDVSVTSGS